MSRKAALPISRTSLVRNLHDELAAIGAIEELSESHRRVLEAALHVHAVFDAAFPMQLRKRSERFGKTRQVIENDEALNGRSLQQDVRVKARPARGLVVSRDESAQRNACTDGKVLQDGIQDRTARIIEVHVDAGGRERAQALQHILALVID